MLPNFLIVGAAKTGTTSLAKYLGAHPDIFIAPRVDTYFLSGAKMFRGPYDEKYNFSVVKSLREYEQLFSGVKNEKAIGEKATDYLYYHSDTIPNIKNYLGKDTKIIIVLREPVSRAFSHYKYMINRKGQEFLTFPKALQTEDKRKQDGWRWGFHYASQGFYAEAVKDYLDNFQKVKVVLTEDLKNDTPGTLRSIYEFLGVESNFQPDLTHSNVGKEAQVPRNLPAKKILAFFNKCKITRPLTRNSFIKELLYSHARLDEKTKKKLKNKFRPDIEKLEKIIDRDLSDWKK